MKNKLFTIRILLLCILVNTLVFAPVDSGLYTANALMQTSYVGVSAQYFKNEEMAARMEKAWKYYGPFKDSKYNYFTKNGKACTCHKKKNCVYDSVKSGSGCNCLRKVTIEGQTFDVLAVQCMGYANYIQYMLFGAVKNYDPKKIYKEIKPSSGSTTNIAGFFRTYKEQLHPGTQLRIKSNGHSIILLALDYSKETITFIDCNSGTGYPCIIRDIQTMSWTNFKTLYQNINYAVVCNDYYKLYPDAVIPTVEPTEIPEVTEEPTMSPIVTAGENPTGEPTVTPGENPTGEPTVTPGEEPSISPSAEPSNSVTTTPEVSLSPTNSAELSATPALTPSTVPDVTEKPTVTTLPTEALPPTPTNTPTAAAQLSATPTPTELTKNTPTPTNTNTPTPTNTNTPTPTNTNTPTPTNTNTPTPTNTNTPTPTNTNTPTPTNTNTPTPTNTNTPTPTNTNTPTPTNTNTPTPTNTNTPTPTNTNTPTPTNTNTPTPTNTNTPTPTNTNTPTPTNTNTPTPTNTNTPTPTNTNTPTPKPTKTPTPKPTKTPTPKPTKTPTPKPTKTPTPTDTPTVTPTKTPTVTPTETPTVTPTPPPDVIPSEMPTDDPDVTPTETPTDDSDVIPSEAPTDDPDVIPSETPTEDLDVTPSEIPTDDPDVIPSETPTDVPIETPLPTETPTPPPPSVTPTFTPTATPLPQASSLINSGSWPYTSSDLVTLKEYLSSSELNRVSNGDYLDIWLETKELNQSFVEEAARLDLLTRIYQRFSKKAKITFYDISLFKQIGSETSIMATSEGLISLELKAPSDYKQSGTLFRTQEFAIYRYHDGVVEEIPCTYDEETQQFYFESDQFSTFAVVYIDYFDWHKLVAHVDSHVPIWVLCVFLALLITLTCMLVSFIKIRKRTKNSWER